MRMRSLFGAPVAILLAPTVACAPARTGIYASTAADAPLYAYVKEARSPLNLTVSCDDDKWNVKLEDDNGNQGWAVYVKRGDPIEWKGKGQVKSFTIGQKDASGWGLKSGPPLSSGSDKKVMAYTKSDSQDVGTYGYVIEVVCKPNLGGDRTTVIDPDMIITFQ